MCLAVPSKIIKIQDLNAIVEVYDAQRSVSLLLMPDDAKDWRLCACACRVRHTESR